MPKVMLDPSGYVERTPLEAGVYDAVIDTSSEDCVVKTSDRTGVHYIPVRFLIDVDGEQYTLTRNFNVTGKGVYYTLRFLRELGLWDGNTSSQVEFDTRKLHGIRCKVNVTKSVNDNGRETNDIETVMPVAKTDRKATKAASFI